METMVDAFVCNLRGFVASAVLDMAYQPESDLLAVLRPNEVELIRLSTFDALRSIPLGEGRQPRRVFLGRNDTLILVFAGSRVEVRSLRTHAWRQTLIADAQALVSAAYARSGDDAELLALAAHEGYTSVFRNDAAGQTDYHLQARYAHPRGQPALSCALHVAEGVVATGYLHGDVRVNALRGGATRWYAELGSAVWALAAAAEVLAVGCESGELHLLHWEDGSILHSFACAAAAVRAIVCDANRVFFSGADARVFLLGRDAAGWSLRDKTRGQSHDVNALLLLPGREVLLSAGKNTDVCYLPLSAEGFGARETDKKRHETHIPQSLVFHCAHGLMGVAHNGAIGLSRVENDGSLRKLFELRTREPIAHAAVSPQGEFVAVASDSKEHVRVYNAKTSQMVSTVAGAAQKVCFMGEDLLFFASDEKSIKISTAKSSFRSVGTMSNEILNNFEFVDKLRLSLDASRLLLADNVAETLLLCNLRKKKFSDHSHLLRGKSRTVVEFGDKSNEFFLLRNNMSLYSYNVETGAIRKRLSTVCTPLLRPIRGMLVVRNPTRILLHSADNIVRIVPDEPEKTAIVKRKKVLFLGYGPEENALSVEIDWKENVVKELGLPVNTQKFLSGRRVKN